MLTESASCRPRRRSLKFAGIFPVAGARKPHRATFPNCKCRHAAAGEHLTKSLHTAIRSAYAQGRPHAVMLLPSAMHLNCPFLPVQLNSDACVFPNDA